MTKDASDHGVVTDPAARIRELESKVETLNKYIDDQRAYIPKLVLWPPKECPVCDLEFGEHTKGCEFLKQHQQREDAAKATLKEVGLERIDDALNLLSARNANSLGGSLFRLLTNHIEALETTVRDMEFSMNCLVKRSNELILRYKQDIDVIEKHWCQ